MEGVEGVEGTEVKEEGEGEEGVGPEEYENLGKVPEDLEDEGEEEGEGEEGSEGAGLQEKSSEAQVRIYIKRNLNTDPKVFFKRV